MISAHKAGVGFNCSNVVGPVVPSHYCIGIDIRTHFFIASVIIIGNSFINEVMSSGGWWPRSDDSGP